MKGEMIAKLKFWFGDEYKDLFNPKYVVEQKEGSYFVYIYEVEKNE